MTQRIVITIETPDGVHVDVSRQAAEIFAEEPPFPVEPAFRGSASQHPLPPPSVCPVHGKPWKLVPAGISKKTGKPYSAFEACPEQGCNERPR